MGKSSHSDVFANYSLLLPPSPSIPYTLKNNFGGFSWDYPDYRWLYCTDGHWVSGKRNVLIGGIYIAEYFFCLTVYAPFLLEMATPDFLQHACYKLLLAVGLMNI